MRPLPPPPNPPAPHAGARCANPLPVADNLVERLDALLPQTQCRRCGYPDCRSYAQALAAGTAEINQCPPGGEEGVARLAALLGRPALPLNPAHGLEGPMTVAVIDEQWCIGCTLCLKACPTDAIVGAHKRMHTLIDAYCTGCDLCLPVCPVDCIQMVPVDATATGWAAWSPAQAEQARQRYRARQARLQRTAEAHQARLLAKAEAKLADLPAHSKHTDPAVLERKRALIEAALARARAARAAQAQERPIGSANQPAT
ncbi:MAG: ferredoxin [Comamonadaceae bacterium]|nr:ferredoxin [Comamonadaceae bacterium]